MSGHLTDYATGAVMDLVLGGVPWAPSPYLTFGLSLGVANRSGRVIEPKAPCYHRLTIANDTRLFPRAAMLCGLKSNAVDLDFPTPCRDWGLVRSIFVAESCGAIVAMIDLTSPMLVRGGDDAPRIRAGAICWE